MYNIEKMVTHKLKILQCLRNIFKSMFNSLFQCYGERVA